jgi:hypothetical protein
MCPELISTFGTIEGIRATRCFKWIVEWSLSGCELIASFSRVPKASRLIGFARFFASRLIPLWWGVLWHFPPCLGYR